MGVLTNPRHEIFAREIAKGSSQREAYKAAGYEAENLAAVDSSAYRLLSDAEVSARVAEIQAAASKRAEITIERTLLELAKIGYGDIRNAVRWSNVQRTRTAENAAPSDAPVTGDSEQEILESEVLLVPSDEVDDDTAAAIAEVSQGRNGLKIKMHDKLGALRLIGQHLGMYTEKVEHSGSVSLPPLQVTIEK